MFKWIVVLVFSGYGLFYDIRGIRDRKFLLMGNEEVMNFFIFIVDGGCVEFFFFNGGRENLL